MIKNPYIQLSAGLAFFCATTYTVSEGIVMMQDARNQSLSVGYEDKLHTALIEIVIDADDAHKRAQQPPAIPSMK